MEEELITLLGGLGYTAAWAQIPRDTDLPYVVLFRVSGVDDITLDGRSGFVSGRVQVDCYGATYAEAITASRAITAALSGYHGGSIWHASLDAIRDRPEADAGSVQHRVQLDFAVLYRE